MGTFPHFRGWCPHQHLGYLQVGFSFTFGISSLQVRDPFLVRIYFYHLWQVVQMSRFHPHCILMMATLIFYQISLLLRPICLTQSVPLILVVSLCVMASIYNLIFCFWSNLYSSHKNNLSFKMWKVGYATKLANNFMVYTS